LSSQRQHVSKRLSRHTAQDALPNVPSGAARPSFFPLGLPQAYPWATAILVDKLDAGGLERSLDYFKSCSAGFGQSGLDLTNSHDANTGSICQLLLCPVEQSAGCPALCRGDHCRNLAKEADSIKSVENRLTALYIYFRLFHRIWIGSNPMKEPAGQNHHGQR